MLPSHGVSYTGSSSDGVVINRLWVQVHVEAHDLDRETFGRVLAALGPPIKDLNFKVRLHALLKCIGAAVRRG